MSHLGPVSTRSEALGRVLVVDRARRVRLLVARALRDAGYEVDDADDGGEALRRLALESYDALISDLRMPALSGLELLAAVKRLSPDVEVIVLSSSDPEDMKSAIQALRLGAHDYVTRPPAAAADVVMAVQRAVEKKRLKESNQRLLRELESLGRTDPLTQVASRRALDQALAREIARARRHGYGLGVIDLDIDHFGAVNDTVGRQGGDQLLAAFAHIVASTLREGDIVYRYDADEFVVLLPYAELPGSLLAAERLVAAVSARPIPAGHVLLPVTTSAGVACLNLDDAGAETLLARAQAAAADAKAAGRNRALATPSAAPRAAVVRRLRRG